MNAEVHTTISPDDMFTVKNLHNEILQPNWIISHLGVDFICQFCLMAMKYLIESWNRQ